MEWSYDKISSIVVDESENMVYISDPDTYELIYLNRATRDKFRVQEEDYKRKPCYKILQNLDEPCSFCTNKYLKESEFYTWKHYNEVLGEHYSLHDKLVDINGKKLRMEICTDVTEAENIHQELSSQLSIEETLVQCVLTLSDNLDMGAAINKLLAILGDFYQADRAYIFEIDYEGGHFSNSYEWCKERVAPQIDSLQELPIPLLERWLEQFRKEWIFHITSLGTTIEKDTAEYEILSRQGIESLVAAPLLEGEKITGFIGVDNPSRRVEHTRLLQSVTYFIQNDITKRRMFQKLKEQTYTDFLTGLGNRNRYIETLERLEKEKLDSLGVIFIDINNLKKANDNFGHQYGDRMIQDVARGLKESFPENAYRIGGDEFVALYINGSRKEFDKRIQKLQNFQKEESICDFSMGNNFNEGSVDLRAQIGYSDHMMYSEKQIYYAESQKSRKTHHIGLAKQLQEEIKAGVFQVYLQSQVDMKSGYLYGAEALVRKIDKSGEVISPDRFIAVYEAEEVIQYIDVFVFEEACRILRDWREQGLRVVPVSVNFSRISLMGKNIIKELAAIRDSYGVEPQQIGIEVTESISRIDSRILGQLMEDIKRYKLVLSLDDFGSEYSSFSILKNLEFDELKLDKSLIQGIENNPRAQVIVEYIVAMCKSLKEVVCVAEGVENERQRELLEKFCCDIGQGYLFSKPIPREDFLEKYRERMV